MKSAIALASILCFAASENLCGLPSETKTACVENCGETAGRGTFWSYSASRFWDSSGRSQSAYNDFEIKEYIFSFAYGLTRCDTLSVRGGWARVEESMNGRVFGFEDCEIGWKHSLGEKWGHLMAVELVGILPVEDTYKPGVRYGEYGAEINLLMSSGFELYNRRGSYDLRAGYRAYAGFPSDQIRADGSVLFMPWPKVMLTASGHLEYGLFTGHSRTDASLFLLNPNYRLLRAQVEATFCLFKRVSPFVGYQRHVWGRNVGTGGGLYGGLQAKF